MTDFATVIRARGRHLAKTIRADGSAEADTPRTVDLRRVEVPNLDSIAALLRNLAERRDCCIVRGEIIDPARVSGVRRLCRPDPETGDAPTLREAAHHWLALDLDSLPLPEGTDAADLPACARAVLVQLPPAFHGARCIVQATASHGIKPGARLRLWFWLSRPLTNAECKAWLRTARVDRTLYSPAQPHYTAAPVFDGRPDPMPHRLAELHGTAEVEPPSAAALTPPGNLAAGMGRPLAASGYRPRHDSADRFVGLLRTVLQAPEGQRHPALFWAACRAGEMVAEGAIGAETAARALTQAAMEGGGQDAHRAERTARDGIARGMMEAPR